MELEGKAIIDLNELDRMRQRIVELETGKIIVCHKYQRGKIVLNNNLDDSFGKFRVSAIQRNNNGDFVPLQLREPIQTLDELIENKLIRLEVDETLSNETIECVDVR